MIRRFGEISFIFHCSRNTKKFLNNIFLRYNGKQKQKVNGIIVWLSLPFCKYCPLKWDFKSPFLLVWSVPYHIAFCEVSNKFCQSAEFLFNVYQDNQAQAFHHPSMFTEPHSTWNRPTCLCCGLLQDYACISQLSKIIMWWALCEK